MFRVAKPVCITMVTLLFTIFGCSSADENPTTPFTDNNLIQSENSWPGNTQDNCELWAAYDIEFDPESGEANIIPLRSTLFEANITQFLQPPISPSNLLSIEIKPESDFPSGLVICDISLQHPFPGTQYCGFDVRGIVMGPGGTHCDWDTGLYYPDAASVRLLNADGWSRWWNQIEFTSFGSIFGYTEGQFASNGFTATTTLNPYKYFCDELDPESLIGDVTESGRGFFSSSSPAVNTRLYELQFPGADLRFKYAITANWNEPIPGSDPPWNKYDFGVDTNLAEAFRIEVLDDGSTAFYENSGSLGGNLALRIYVSDWQLLEGGPVEDQVSGIFLESPTLFTGVLDIFNPAEMTSGPDAMTSGIDVLIEDVSPDAVEGQLLIIHVTSTSPATYEPQIPGPTGFDWPQDALLASHLVWEAPIKIYNPADHQAPVADASQTYPTFGPPPLLVHFDPTDSYDPDGIIEQYLWDFENDGIFDAITTTPIVVDHEYTVVGQYHVNLMVTDNDGIDDELDTPLIISVGTDVPPVADASATNPTSGPAPFTVQLDPSNSYDPDGSIVLYEWDFENDGTYDTSDSTPVIIGHEFTDPGQYDVNLRVTDDDALTDELDTPLVITVLEPGDTTTWAQYQATTDHTGDIYWETVLSPPLSEVWSTNLSHPITMVYIPDGTPVVGDGYVMVLYSDSSIAGWAEFFDFTDGNSLWEYQITPNGNNGAMCSQTGCYANGLFYTPGDLIRCLDPVSETVIWSYPDPPVGGSGPGSMVWATTQCSLVYNDGKIYARLGSGPTGYKLIILNAATGSLVDEITVYNGRTWLPFTLDDNIAYVQEREVITGQLYYGRVSAYNLTTHGKLWTFDTDNPPGPTGDSSMFGPMTVPGNGYVYFGCYNNKFYAIDETSGSLGWSVPIHSGQQYCVETAAYHNGYLFFGETGGNTISNFVCYDASNGSEIWSYAKGGALVWDEWSGSAPIVVNDVVYAGVSNLDDAGCEFVGLDISNGDVLFSVTAPGSGWGDPVAVDGKLLVTSGFQDKVNNYANPYGTLWCFD